MAIDETGGAVKPTPDKREDSTGGNGWDNEGTEEKKDDKTAASDSKAKNNYNTKEKLPCTSSRINW